MLALLPSSSRGYPHPPRAPLLQRAWWGVVRVCGDTVRLESPLTAAPSPAHPISPSPSSPLVPAPFPPRSHRSPPRLSPCIGVAVPIAHALVPSPPSPPSFPPLCTPPHNARAPSRVHPAPCTGAACAHSHPHPARTTCARRCRCGALVVRVEPFEGKWTHLRTYVASFSSHPPPHSIVPSHTPCTLTSCVGAPPVESTPVPAAVSPLRWWGHCCRRVLQVPAQHTGAHSPQLPGHPLPIPSSPPSFPRLALPVPIAPALVPSPSVAALVSALVPASPSHNTAAQRTTHPRRVACTWTIRALAPAVSANTVCVRTSLPRVRRARRVPARAPHIHAGARTEFARGA
ncbi:hypothetical protein B0H16DRAFT_460223 [Mycena metata]|uniref:Uncharacterized protein n=1 Tax=Mycena metata TaxID=1033252 RepID=A0AAD7MG76_9AGAR|nr:hypothetical protein B0H16DRAFT_460223 [Mycena metata]